jgi:hypothetical protein
MATKRARAAASGRDRTYGGRLQAVRRVCARVAAGATVSEACRHPMLPYPQQIAHWAAEEPVFRALLAEARKAGGMAHLARPGREGDFPEDVIDEFLERIAAGRGLVEVCSQPDMPTTTTIYRWLNTKADFAERYERARRVQADVLFDLAWTIARQATEDNVRVCKLLVETIKWRTAQLAPSRYGTSRQAHAFEPPPQIELVGRRFRMSMNGEVEELSMAECIEETRQQAKREAARKRG